MSWLRPSGLTWRIVVVVLLGVVLFQAVGLVRFMVDRRERAEEIMRTAARQVVATTRLYEAAAPDERRLVLEAVAGPLLRVRHAPNLDFLTRRGWEPAPFWLAGAIRARLGPIGDRALEVYVRDRIGGRDWHPHHDGFARHGHGFEPSRRRLAVSVPLTTGGWLTFLVASDATSLRWVAQTALFWALTLVLVLIVVLWAGRRLSRPFQRFADAADRLGTDLKAPPLQETGTGELRQAIRAFNRMQDRIRRMVDDRTMMLAAISHDLRTVLTRLRLRTELIDDREQRARAEGDVEEMERMVEASLAFARGGAEGERTELVDLAALLQTVVADARTDAVTYEGPDRYRFRGRPSALRRLFDNLVDNAVRYGGGATVGLADEGRQALVTVADNGPGLDSADLARVFEPFFRVERSRSRATGGVGLGLAIARSIAREHGGDITLENRVGSGLLATVTLPDGGAVKG